MVRGKDCETTVTLERGKDGGAATLSIRFDIDQNETNFGRGLPLARCGTRPSRRPGATVDAAKAERRK
jgi:hypothetical protein